MAKLKYIDGADKVERLFARLPRENAERIADALNRGGREIAAAARILVPVESGDLKRTIDVLPTEIRMARSGRGVAVYVVAGTTTQTQLEARVQEFGRAPGGAGEQADHPGHAAQPFLFPAYHALRKRVIGRVRREIKRGAKAAAAKS